MRYRDISLDELEEIEQELYLSGENSRGLLNYTKIEIYDAMHTHLSILCKDDKDYLDYYTYIKKKLVSHLLRYSSSVHGNTVKERSNAEKVLKRVQSYDQKNPVASYRLGCLMYLQKKFSESIGHFQKALDCQKNYSDKAFLLSTEQISRAVSYLSNCSLHTACQALVISSENGRHDEGNLIFSGFFTQLSYNEGVLKSQAYGMTTLDGNRYCSIEECMETCNSSPKDTIMLYFGDTGAELFYNGIKEAVAAPQAHVLRHVLLHAHQPKTVTPISLKDYFLDSHVIWGASKHALELVMENLNTILAELETQVSIKVTESGYRLSGSFEYILMERADEHLAD
ncbi:MAG TPA: hypothetical protein VLQ20_08695 [Planococcus sp. (in: firmicutes)]|nr:hypothetical protein [Planococcus sp. (in: firmicutes)]